MGNRIRDLRDSYPQHIWVRGNNRRRLFSYQRDFEHFLRILNKAAAKRAVEIWALALMSNHYHLIATPLKAVELPGVLKETNQRWAQVRNHGQGRSGKLFEQSYGSKLIETSGQLVVSTLYVEANPTLAGMAAHPSDYRYTSYNIHAGGNVPSRILRAVITPSPWIAGLASTRTEQKLAYQRLMRDYLVEKKPPPHVSGEGFDASRTLPPRRPDRSRAT